MSWLKIDDGFEDHPKVAKLSDSAHRLWLRAACWCRKSSNAHTNGFVPRAMLSIIACNSSAESRLERLANELVGATAGGMFEKGLWEVVDGGWKFHDWAQYQPSNEKPKPMSRAESARVAGLRSAEARRARSGTAQPTSPERPERRSNDSNDVVETVRENPRTTFDRTIPERPEPPLPLPLPDLDPVPKEPDRSLVSTALPAAHTPRKDRFLDSFAGADPVAVQLFEAWRSESGKTGATFDPKARTLFERLALEGVTAEQVSECVRGARLDEWATGVAKLGASAILGSSEQREKFAAMARDPPKPRGRSRQPPQPNDENNRYIPRII